jgi:hypothetical protein
MKNYDEGGVYFKRKVVVLGTDTDVIAEKYMI